MDDSGLLQHKMSRFTNAVKDSLRQENWYSALTLALTLPDICGKLESPNSSSSKRYIKWFDQYLDGKYYTEIQGNKIVFLTGRDAYALRCSYLHGGEGDISAQRVQELLEECLFMAPKFINGEFTGPHCNQINNKLQLRVDLFCLDICSGVDKWVENNKGKKKLHEVTSKMLEIHEDGITLYNGGIRIE
jgi:hypothetical protein